MIHKTRVSRFWLALLLPIFLSDAQGGVPRLIRDLNTIPLAADSSPMFLGKLGDVSLYSAQVDNKSRLVRSDGTSDGTFIIKTFTGFGASMPSTKPVMQVGPNAYFVAHETATGVELWVTDATANGTHIVADLTAGSFVTLPRFLGEFNGKLAFSATSDSGVRELYVTDGTQAGTTRLTNFSAAKSYNATDEFAVAGGKIYFTALSASCANCTSLWVSDGTVTGTHAVSGLEAYGPNPAPRSLRAVGDRVLLTGSSASGVALFSVDAATDAASLLSVVVSGPISDITVLNGYGYFVGFFSGSSEEIWRSDGTPAGTVQVTNIPPASTTAAYISYALKVVNNRLVFVANNGAVSPPQLWATDGTPGNQTVLTALSGVNGWDLYAIPSTERHLQVRATGVGNTTAAVVSTDGTPAGTSVLPTSFNGQPLTFLNIAGDATSEFLRYSTPGPNNTTTYLLFSWTGVLTPLMTSGTNNLAQLTMSASHGALLFNASDSTHGNELWISDSTGTRLLANISPDTDTEGSYPYWLTDWNGSAVFSADDNEHGYELWTSDGTDAGTRLLVDIVPGPDGSTPSNLMVLNGALYFFTTNGTTSQFMKLAPGSTKPEVITDLTPQSTYWTGIPPLLGRCGGATSALLGGKLYFPAGNTAHGFELWVTDGTAAGTHEVADLNPGGDASPCDLTVMGNRLYFSADGGLGHGGVELWSTDGTASGTHQVADIAPGDAHSSPQALVPMGGSLYFEAANGLFKTDGTAAGTQSLSLPSATEPFDAFPIGVLNGKLLLLKPTGPGLVVQSEIWTSDGTPAGTLRIPDVLTLPFSVPLLTSSGSSFYFANSKDPADVEPWITDGTVAGTHRVADLNSSGNSNPAGFMEFRGTVLIAAVPLQDGNFETALWRTDGTPTGTARLGVAGFPLSLGYNEGKGFLVLGQNLIYTGEEKRTGGELYVVPNDRPVAVNDSASASSNQPAIINVLSNDADPDGTLIRSAVRLVQAPAHGSASIAVDGTIAYTPEAGHSGSDSLSYAVTDNQGYESNAATVTLTVSGTSPKGGGGAMQWWAVLMLALIAVLKLASDGRRRRLNAFVRLQ